MSRDHVHVDSYPLLISRMVSKLFFSFFFNLFFFFGLAEPKPGKRTGYEKNSFNPRKSHIPGTLQLPKI